MIQGSSRVCLFFVLFGLGFGCTPTARERLGPHLGKTGRVLFVASVDPADGTHQWFEDVRLVRIVHEDGDECLLVRFEGLETSPASGGQPIEIPVPLARIVEIQVGGASVYHRDP